MKADELSDTTDSLKKTILTNLYKSFEYSTSILPSYKED